MTLCGVHGGYDEMHNTCEKTVSHLFAIYSIFRNLMFGEKQGRIEGLLYLCTPYFPTRILHFIFALSLTSFLIKSSTYHIYHITIAQDVNEFMDAHI